MIEAHTHTDRYRYRADTSRGTWLVAGDRAHRLGDGGLPAGAAESAWVLVEAKDEREALRRAREYRESRGDTQ